MLHTQGVTGSSPAVSTKHPKNPLFKRVFVLTYTFLTRFICEKAFLNDLIQYFDSPFLFFWIEVGIGVPRHFDPGMSEAAGYFLDIDPGICQKGGVRVPEVVDADFFDPGHLGKLFVVQLDCGIPQGTGTAADLICFRKSGNCFPSCLVLVQNSQKGGRGFAVSG